MSMLTGFIETGSGVVIRLYGRRHSSIITRVGVCQAEQEERGALVGGGFVEGRGWITTA